MARRIPEDRFDALVRGATGVFIERGYRRTQMADVAGAIGVAKGTLYGYVDGKEALLALCLENADQPAAIAVPEALPLTNPKPGELAERVRAALAAGARQPRLERALESAPGEANPDEELRGIVGELFDLMHANRFGIKLLDRCMDHPELEGLWQDMGREQIRVAMGRYLTARSEAGALRPLPDPRFAARFVIEVCATWAVHIHWDRAPQAFEPGSTRAGVIDNLARSLAA